MRTLIAWVIGITSTLLLWGVFIEIGHALGIQSSIQLAEPILVDQYGSEELIDSYTTSFGEVSMIFGILVGAWAGQAVYWRSMKANFTDRGALSFKAWFFALSILVVLTGVIALAFRNLSSPIAGYIRMALELASYLGVGWSCRQWFNNRVR